MREPVFSENAITVLRKRYLSRDGEGNVIETPQELLWRVARNVALMDILDHPEVRGETPWPVPGTGRDWAFSPTDRDMDTLHMAYGRLARQGRTKCDFQRVRELVEREAGVLGERAGAFYELMAGGECLPNSPALMNAGRELQQLSACFVLPVEDSMVSIFDSLKHAALIHQSGGGTGFAFSRLRPKNDVVRSTGGVASGPVSFMRVFNSATEAVKQGGTRRGANMGILRVDHPDILEFIACKERNSDITNFNISVGLTDSFMQAVDSQGEYALVNPRDGKVTATLAAREVFDLIVHHAWKNGEPGIVFLDRLNRDNPTPELGEIESTNPCGEQPLLPYEACCLASINLAKFAGNELDWSALSRCVRLAIHFLDNLIDANKYPLAEIELMVLGNRKVGLGVMGWADCLIKLGIPYDSPEAVALADRVMGFIRSEAVAASAGLADQRRPFPNFPRSTYHRAGLAPLRNATTTTIAPTGTISIIAGTSSGIEPLFSIAFTRHVLDQEQLVEVNPLFEEVAQRLGVYSRELMARIAQAGTLANITELPEEVRRVFVTAHDITPEWHIRMQAAFQKHTDNAVSKTVNFPHSASEAQVAEVFRLAYRLGCKGVTVYRDGSREFQVLTSGPGAAPGPAPRVPHDVNGSWGKIRPIARPTRLSGCTDQLVTPLGKLFLTLNALHGHPLEMFAQIGKAGSDVSAFTEGIARLISLSLRAGVDPHEVADQLRGIGGSSSVGFGPHRVRSVPDAIGQFLAEYLNAQAGDDEGTGSLPLREVGGRTRQSFQLCPACGCHSLAHEEGCAKCFACGYSEC
ncbi:MAG TPA: ribonucleotide-diphosphate reductase subunit alpha [Clostridiales bacterium UBA8153]|nr:ribonucleotide-diphosphate reductase subunit alpha [Clostridiales bacterium UBA8153]